MKNEPIRFAVLLAAVRVAVQVLLIILEKIFGEASMLLLADVPTLLVCWVYSMATHRVIDMGNVYDARTFLVAIITWFVLGGVIGLVVAGTKRRGNVPRQST